MVRVWPHGVFKVSDKKLDDGQWHQMVLQCEDNQPIRTYIDNMATSQNEKGSQSTFKAANRVNFGSTADGDKELFTGYIRNFKYEKLTLYQKSN